MKRFKPTTFILPLKEYSVCHVHRVENRHPNDDIAFHARFYRNDCENGIIVQSKMARFLRNKLSARDVLCAAMNHLSRNDILNGGILI